MYAREAPLTELHGDSVRIEMDAREAAELARDGTNRLGSGNCYIGRRRYPIQ